MKMEVQGRAAAEKQGGGSSIGEKRPCVSWVGGPGERPSRPTPKEIKLEPGELCWEARWQEYLRMLQDPDCGWRQPASPPEEDPEELHSSSRGEPAAMNPLPKTEHATRARPGDAHGWGLDPTLRVKEEATEEEEEESATSEMWRQGFRHLPYQEAKGPREICRQLLGLCRQWLKPDVHPVERILDLLVLEQFLAILPEEMQSWVKGSGARSCAQAVVLAEHFLARALKAEKLEGQVLEPFEEVIVNSPETEWILPETEEQHPLSVEAKPEGEAELFQAMEGNGQIVEDDGEIHLPPRPEQAAVRDVSFEGDRGRFLQTPEVREGPEDQQGTKNYHAGQYLRNNSSPAGIDVPVTETATGKSRKSLARSPGRGQPRKESYACSYCGKKWPCQSQLLRHESIHTGEKPHRCAKCGKSFNRRSNLTTHERTHTGEKPHKCPQCGKSFIRRTHLTKHKRTHAKEKTCGCSGCRRSSSLTLGVDPRAQCSAHARSFPGGRGAKPDDSLGPGRLNKCSYCGRSFSCHTRFLRHEKSHTKERPYPCPDCGKSFCTSSNLSQHRRTHTGERPYRCRHCGKSYRRKSSLVQHEQETCQSGASLSAPPVGFVVLGNCALLCMNEADQAGAGGPLAPETGTSLPASQPLSAFTGRRP